MKELSRELKLFKRNEINDLKWNNAIGGSYNGRVYATTTWLDYLSPQWQAIIFGDYEIIVPLPVKEKFGLRYIMQPAFTQQLGIFYRNEISDEQLRTVFIAIQNNFKYGVLNINENIADYNLHQNKNYILDLSIGYESLYKNFKKSLKKNSLRPLEKSTLQYFKNNKIEEGLNHYYLLNNQKMRVNNSQFKPLLMLLLTLEKTGDCFSRYVTNENEILAISVFVQDGKRIYNLTSATTQAGRKIDANYFLYHNLIKEFAGQDIILDFEGSNVPSIENFYQKWGSILEPYYTMKWNNLPFPINLLKK